MVSKNMQRTLDAAGLRRFQALQPDAVGAVAERFYATHGSVYEQFGPRGREACREDLGFHLGFLRPVLEFGAVEPLVDYLCWLESVLAARAIPVEHLALSLEWLAEFFSEKMDAGDGAAVSTALMSARTKFLDARGVSISPLKLQKPWPETAVFEMALLAGNQRDALAIVDRCLAGGHSLIEVEMHVIQPALYQIGEKWQANQVTVAQEHMATAIAQSVMTLGLMRTIPPASIGKKVLLAGVEGNNHVVGLRMVADAFQLAGWDVQYLCANVPTRALVQQVTEWKPDLVGLSVSFAQQLRKVKEVIAQIGERLHNAKPSIIIGGLAINRFAQLVDVVGADAWSADAESAVTCASRLVCR